MVSQVVIKVLPGQCLNGHCMKPCVQLVQAHNSCIGSTILQSFVVLAQKQQTVQNSTKMHKILKQRAISWLCHDSVITRYPLAYASLMSC